MSTYSLARLIVVLLISLAASCLVPLRAPITWAATPGTLYTWGYNASGQLGNGTTANSSTPSQANGLSGVTTVAGGSNHVLALLADGSVRAWGGNAFGQLGNGSTTDSNQPVQVSGLTSITTISAGVGYSLALRSDGTVWA